MVFCGLEESFDDFGALFVFFHEFLCADDGGREALDTVFEGFFGVVDIADEDGVKGECLFFGEIEGEVEEGLGDDLLIEFVEGGEGFVDGLFVGDGLAELAEVGHE